jgi:intein/homing endonuclease
MEEDLAILVGMLLTDGCVSSERLIIFHSKSEALIKVFKNSICRVFGQVHFTERTESNGTKRIQIASKELVKKLTEMCKIETFRRKRFVNGNLPETRIPDFVKNLPEDVLLKFLQVVFSTDGSISVSVRWHKTNKNWEIRKRIELSCKHKNLKNDFLEILRKTGFSPTISNDNITIQKKQDILNFSSKVRFIPGVKIGGDSNNWKGFEKNQILDLAVKSFGFKNLKRFETKQQIINFLKSQIPTPERVA